MRDARYKRDKRVRGLEEMGEREGGGFTCKEIFEFKASTLSCFIGETTVLHHEHHVWMRITHSM